jgi:DNA-binding transcriptional MerR regulator
MDGPWTILELAELAAGTLAASQPIGSDEAGTQIGSDEAGTRDGPEGAATEASRARTNGRVRDVPNERLVRWYVTVGLVDPPLSRRGRIARYGRRHLLQLVAVKRRQAEGRSLAEIQAELAGATDETLAAIARVPDAVLAPDALRGGAPSAPSRFWTRQARQPDEPAPNQPAPDEAAPDQPAPNQTAPDQPAPNQTAPDQTAPDQTAPDQTAPDQTAPDEPAPDAAAYGDHGLAVPPTGLVHGVRLAPGVMLLLEGAGREPGPDDVTEIVRAAQPLLAELASRRLFASGPGVLPDAPGRSSGVGSSPRRAEHDH